MEYTEQMAETELVPEISGGIDSAEESPKTGEISGEDYAQQIARLRKEHSAAMDKVRIDGEVRYVLAKMGARNPALAAKALDMSGVQVNADTVSGVEESVKKLMASDPYLFGSGNLLPPTGKEGSTGGVHGVSERDPETLSDGEYYRMIGVKGKR